MAVIVVAGIRCGDWSKRWLESILLLIGGGFCCHSRIGTVLDAIEFYDVGGGMSGAALLFLLLLLSPIPPLSINKEPQPWFLGVSFEV